MMVRNTKTIVLIIQRNPLLL